MATLHLKFPTAPAPVPRIAVPAPPAARHKPALAVTPKAKAATKAMSSPAPPMPKPAPQQTEPPPEFCPRVWMDQYVSSWLLGKWEPLVLLMSSWPAVLPNKVGDRIKPFKTGIFDELAALLPPGDEDALNLLRSVLRVHCRSPDYVYSVAMPGAMRHGLDGQPVGPVSDEDARTARIALVQCIRTTKNRERTADGCNAEAAGVQ